MKSHDVRSITIAKTVRSADDRPLPRFLVRTTVRFPVEEFHRTSAIDFDYGNQPDTILYHFSKDLLQMKS